MIKSSLNIVKYHTAELSEKGFLQAKELQSRFQQTNFIQKNNVKNNKLFLKIELIVCSPLKRAVQTANFISGTVEIEVLDFLSEKSALETEEALGGRCQRFMNWLKYGKEKAVLVVGHGKFLRKLLNPHVYFGNCAVYLSELSVYPNDSTEWGFLSKEMEPSVLYKEKVIGNLVEIPLKEIQ